MSEIKQPLCFLAFALICISLVGLLTMNILQRKYISELKKDNKVKQEIINQFIELRNKSYE